MAVAIISEFNPFHNGHRYLVQKAKELTSEPVIAVMSGSFTQRGEVAVADKFSRAKTALENGVDLVLELPCAFAVANAQQFAECGVLIAKSFESVNYLAFGCETDDITVLQNAAAALENQRVKEILKAEMKKGSYYPRAVEYAVRAVFGDETGGVLTTPNNILAVEYIRGLKGSNIRPLPVARIGAEHDSEKASGQFASASHIRALLRKGENAGAFLPVAPKEITYPENLERIILCKLRETARNSENLKKYPDVSEGLENRIADAVFKYNSLKEIIGTVKTKRYTHARLRRIMTCVLLNITKELQASKADYVRVLGFSESGAALLKTCCAEVVTSAAKALSDGVCNINLLETDILSTDIAALSYNKVQSCGADYFTQIIKK